MPLCAALIDLPEALIVAALILGAALVAAATRLASRPLAVHVTLATPPPPGPAPAPAPTPVPTAIVPTPPVVVGRPISPEGRPVEPSDIPIGPSQLLEVGDRVLGLSQGRWYRARIIEVLSKDRVRVHFPGWEDRWDETLTRAELQVDLNAYDDDENT